MSSLLTRVATYYGGLGDDLEATQGDASAQTRGLSHDLEIGDDPCRRRGY